MAIVAHTGQARVHTAHYHIQPSAMQPSQQGGMLTARTLHALEDSVTVAGHRSTPSKGAVPDGTPPTHPNMQEAGVGQFLTAQKP
jgi:hypothetical protein